MVLADLGRIDNIIRAQLAYWVGLDVLGKDAIFTVKLCLSYVVVVRNMRTRVPIIVVKIVNLHLYPRQIELHLWQFLLFSCIEKIEMSS